MAWFRQLRSPSTKLTRLLWIMGTQTSKSYSSEELPLVITSSIKRIAMKLSGLEDLTTCKIDTNLSSNNNNSNSKNFKVHTQCDNHNSNSSSSTLGTIHFWLIIFISRAAQIWLRLFYKANRTGCRVKMAVLVSLPDWRKTKKQLLEVLLNRLRSLKLP